MNEPQQPQQTTGTPAERNVALAERRHTESWTDPDWQRFWLNVQQRPWRTLALVPAGKGGAADFTLSLAVNLSRVGMTHAGAPILVADGTQVPLNQLNAFLADVRSCTDSGERVIIALPEASDHPTAAPLAKAADGVVLCVLLERMRNSEAKQTIKLIGPAKFLGSISIKANERNSAPPPPK